MTIEKLPDDILLETFEFYLGKDDADDIGVYHNYDEWQMLVHVCRRWRFIVFASPRRLNLNLYLTRRRLVNSKTLDIWPALPIIIYARGMQSKEDVTNVIAALRHHNRVCKIDYYNGKPQDSFLRELAAIDEPFPALTYRELFSFATNVPVLPDSFLGGSTPLLRSLALVGIPYPSIGKLLSSTTNLVRLSLWNIPHSGYISPETIVPCLFMLPMLKSLRLGFQHPRSLPHRTNRQPPPLTRVVFPNLTSLRFCGDLEYLEDILSRIETPMLNETNFHVFNQLVFDTPLLEHFIRRTETFMKIHTAHIQFQLADIQIILSGPEEISNNNRDVLNLTITCKALDWQLSAVTQVLNSFLSCLSGLEILEVVASEDFQGEVEVIQWREFLHLFTSVKKVILESEDAVRHIAPALQEFARERSMLPALQTLLLRAFSFPPPGYFNEAIEKFIATRKSCGQPITVHN